MIGAATIGPLLDWLEDPDPALCSAALSALVQLPLAPTAWGEVADRVLALLAAGSAPMGLFAPAARVPVAEVRERLRERLADGDPTIRRAAADALAIAPTHLR